MFDQRQTVSELSESPNVGAERDIRGPLAQILHVQMSSPAKEGDLPMVTQQLNAGRIPECQTSGWGHFHQEVLLPSHPSSESRHWPLTREILLVAS